MLKQEYPKCDNIECIEFAMKYYIDVGGDGYSQKERKSNIKSLYKNLGFAPIREVGCKRSDGNSALFCAMDAVGDLVDLHKNDRILMEKFSEIAEWKWVGDPICDRCKTI